jgi:hypothetical protein
MIRYRVQESSLIFVLGLSLLVLLGCSSLNAKRLAKKHNRIESANWGYYWDEKWTKIGTLKWHNHDNFLYVNEEEGWAKGTFGKVENHDNEYHLRPVYRFTVVEPSKSEKEIVVRMGYIENEGVFSRANYLENCWSEKLTFEPGSKVLDETVLRDYEIENLEIPSKCLRKSPPY